MKPFEKSTISVALAVCLALQSVLPVLAQDSSDGETNALSDDIEMLLQQLREADDTNAAPIEQKILRIWSHSGSPAMDLLLERGKKALENDDYLAAVEHFSAAIDHAPDFAEAYNGRAAAFFQMREFGLSIADIQQSLVINPNHFGALEGLGHVLLELGDHENALIALRAALAINPHRPDLNESVDRLEKELRDPAL